jgi:glycosyltransferase involved in cell wall biosynthesis
MVRYSGAEISTLELLNALLNEGVRTMLLVPEFRNEKIKKNHVVTFKVPFSSPSSAEDIYLKLGNPLFQFLLVRSLIKQISHFRPDLIHSSNFFGIPATWLASKLTKVPFISHIRDYRLVCSAEICFKRGEINFCGDYQRFLCLLSVTKNPLKVIYGVLVVKLMRYFFQSSRKILVTSNFLSRVMQRILKKKTVTLYNIVTVEHKLLKQRKRDNFHVLYCGRLDESKGLQLLLNVAKGNKDLLLHIAGKGELLGRVLRYVKESENIIYHGFVTTRELYEIIANVDLVVVPSLWPEPFGRIIVESQLIGVPVIASSKGGIPEILPSYCLFNPSEHDLLGKIEDFRENSDKFRSEVDIMLKPERIVKKLLRSYRECISDNR